MATLAIAFSQVRVLNTPVLDADARDIRLSLDGDEQAYARLVERYEAPVSAQMWQFTRDRRMLDELVQDVFVEAYLSLRRFRGDAPFLHWLRRIATRAGYRHWKREARARLTRARIEHAAMTDPPADPATPSEAAEALFGLLERLAPPDRILLTLYYFEGCDTREIAARTGWSTTLVRVRMHRARRRLRQMLSAAGHGRS